MPEALSDDEIGFLLEVLDLARNGRTERLAKLLDAGAAAAGVLRGRRLSVGVHGLSKVYAC